jgi:Domain of unknown function (DUF4388)
MSLRGELREFELPDILQLIASQKKAGWLKVISRGKCHFVFFRDGKITSTKNPAEEEDPLEEYILRRGLLTDDQIDRVAATRRKTGMDVHDILLKEGLLSAEDIQEIFEAMVEHDIFELMSIHTGTYEFETEERPGPVPEGALYAEIGPILMEGARKADEVAEMRRVLGPEDGVLALTAVGRAAQPEYSDESVVLELVNGTRSIDALIEESGLDRYTATRALFDCARQGWVKLSRARDLDHEVDSRDGEFDLRRALRWATPVIVLLAVAILLSTDMRRFQRDDPILGEFLIRSHQLEASDLRESVRMAVEVYRVRRGSYPASLDALLDESLVPEDALRSGDRDRWTYRVDANGTHFALAPTTGP